MKMTTFFVDGSVTFQRTVPFGYGDYNTTADDAMDLVTDVVSANLSGVNVGRLSDPQALVFESGDETLLAIAVAVAVSGKA